MKKTFPTTAAAAQATRMREIPFSIEVAMSAPHRSQQTPASVAMHFATMRAQHRMPAL